MKGTLDIQDDIGVWWNNEQRMEMLRNWDRHDEILVGHGAFFRLY